METVDLGARFARWRRAKGLSQQELAERAGVAQSSIAHLETNRMEPSMSMLGKVVAALGLTTERFFGRLPKAA